MRNAMSHYDWFVADIFSDGSGNIHLGRIGIGIFNQERQPVWSEDGNLAVFLSGEFYQTSQLRKDLQNKGVGFRDDSDIELALRLYQDRGERFVEEVEGIFILGIWDRLHQRLTIANDRFGIYPLYYAHKDGSFILAPEVKAILCDGNFKKTINWIALSEYMCFQCLLGDKTFFEGLRLLPNATILIYDLKTDHLSSRQYWDFSHIRMVAGGIPFEEAVEEAGRLLKAAVKRRMGGSFRKAIHLSAGMDSRTILGLADLEPSLITTITYGDPASRDYEYSRRLAAKAGTKHYSFPFHDGRWVMEYAGLHLDLTEGFHSWIHSHGISILEECRQLTDISLSGFAGGDIDWENPALLRAPDDAAFLSLLFDALSQHTTWPSVNAIEERLLYAPQVSKQLIGSALESLKEELRTYSHLPYPLQALAFSRLNPDRRMFQYYTVFSRAFIELRFPFCDYEYANFIYALPPEFLVCRKLRRALIRRSCPSMGSIPYDRDELPITGNEMWRLALKLWHKGKHQLNRRVAPLFRELHTINSDYENWLRNELKGWGESILLDERTLGRGIFNPDFIRTIWARHQAGLEPFTIGKIAPIMTYELMLRRFYDA
jgi:asparagine synthase (glutamine-hydrolysing)